MLDFVETKSNRGSAFASLKGGLEYCVFGDHRHPFNHLGGGYVWTRPIPFSISGSISHAAAFDVPTARRRSVSEYRGAIRLWADPDSARNLRTVR